MLLVGGSHLEQEFIRTVSKRSKARHPHELNEGVSVYILSLGVGSSPVAQ